MSHSTYPAMVEACSSCDITCAESRLSWPQPGEMRSLWDMNKFQGLALYGAFEQLARTRTLFEHGDFGAIDMDQPIEEDFRVRGRQSAVMIGENTKGLPIPVTTEALFELLDAFNDTGTTFNDIRRLTIEVESTLRREMKTTLLFCVDSKHANYLSDPDPTEPPKAWFGPDVEAKFPQSSEDIFEAARCLALRRNTACVFHLMRAMETTLAILAQHTGATIKNEHGETLPWGTLVSNLKGKVEAMPKGPKQDDWLAAHSMLHSVNRAFRTKTAHPEKTYTDEQAENAFQAVKAFMQELASLV